MSVIQQGLLIAVIGMGLVFAVIIFLWGLMALMMRLTSREKTDTSTEEVIDKSDQPILPATKRAEGQRRAAAMAVAVAIGLAASQSSSPQLQREKNAGELSPWQVYHRIRQSEK